MHAIAGLLLLVVIMTLTPADAEQLGWLRVWQEGSAQQWLNPHSIHQDAERLTADSVFFPEVGEPVTYRSQYRLPERDYRDLDEQGQPLHDWRSLADDPFNQAVLEAAERWVRSHPAA